VTPPARWAGVDVGGRRKGFHVAVVDAERLLEPPVQLPTPAHVAAWLSERRPRLVAVDSPRHPAPHGERSRADERQLARAVCGIRYTPDAPALAANPAYYEWIEHGFALYAALAAAGLPSVECFPTAAFTRWTGARGRERRAVWSQRGLDAMLPDARRPRLGQDARDAIAAALTARAWDTGRADAFGDIVVPCRAGARAGGIEPAVRADHVKGDTR